jgi:hypothetical protein
MLGALKSRSQSEKRLIKLEKKGFELEAEKLRSEYNNKYMLNEIKMQSKSNKKLLTEIAPQKIGHFLRRCVSIQSPQRSSLSQPISGSSTTFTPPSISAVIAQEILMN